MALSCPPALFLGFLIAFFPKSEAERRYICIIDAGSTGSRAHVIGFDTPEAWTPETGIEPLFVPVGSKRVKNGLHTLYGNPESIASHINDLVDFISSLVPASQRPKTPVALWATAGMRLISTEEAEEIFDVCRKSLTASEFLFVPTMARILSGSEEASLAWIGANYLSGNRPLLDPESCALPTPDTKSLFQRILSYFSTSNTELQQSGNDTAERLSRMKSLIVLEMGGASMQIVYPLHGGVDKCSECANLEEEKESLVINECERCKVVSVTRNQQVFLYARSYLTFGIREAQTLFKKLDVSEPCHTKRDSETLVRCGDSIEEKLTGPSIEKIDLPSGKNFTVYATEGFFHAFNFYLARRHPWETESEWTKFSQSYGNLEEVDGYHVNGEILARIKANLDKFCSLDTSEIIKLYPDVKAYRLERFCFAGVYIFKVFESAFGIDLYHDVKAQEKLEGINLYVMSKIRKLNLEWVVGAVCSLVTFDNAFGIDWSDGGFFLPQ